MALSREQWVVAFSISAITAAIVSRVAAHVGLWAEALTAIVCFVPLPWTARRMPEELRGARQRRPVLSVAWLLLVLLAVVQMARLSAFMVDSSRLWGSTVPDPVAANNQCLAAYVHAADLCRRGESNVYDERWEARALMLASASFAVVACARCSSNSLVADSSV